MGLCYQLNMAITTICAKSTPSRRMMARPGHIIFQVPHAYLAPGLEAESRPDPQ